MSPGFAIQPAMAILTNEDFAHTSSLAEATQRKLISDQFPDPSCIHSRTSAEKVGAGVRLRYESRIHGLREKTAIVHKFFFIERSETRETAHIVTPDDPVASTELLVLFDESATRDYFNASVYDNDGRLISTDSIVFNDKGQIVSYPFTQRYVSPLPLREASLTEEVGDDGLPVARFRISFHELTEETSVSLLWEAMGNILRETVTCSAENLEATLDLPLVDNPTAIACDWIAIAVDEHERVIAQTAFALTPAR